MFTEFVRGKIANKTKNAAIKVATHYANVACFYLPAKDECRRKET